MTSSGKLPGIGGGETLALIEPARINRGASRTAGWIWLWLGSRGLYISLTGGCTENGSEV